MLLSSQLEQQLSAMAAGVDRANRPTSLLMIPLLLVIAAVVFLAWSWRDMATQRNLVALRVREVEEINKTVSAIQAEKTKAIDIAGLYPAAPFFGSQVEQAWKQTNIPFREPPIIGNNTPAPILTNPPINRSEIQVTSNSEPLENIMRGVDETLKHEFLRDRAFISMAQLTPAGNGWRSMIRVTLYHSPAQ